MEGREGKGWVVIIGKFFIAVLHVSEHIAHIKTITRIFPYLFNFSSNLLRIRGGEDHELKNKTTRPNTICTLYKFYFCTVQVSV